MNDAALARRLDELAPPGTHRLAAALVDLAVEPVVRTAGLGGGSDAFEIGSISKGLTGMLVADAVARGEVRLETTVGELAPSLAGSPVASVTLLQLCTHTSGLPRLPVTVPMAARGWAFEVAGRDPYRGLGPERVLADAARQRLTQPGRYLYSNLGGALAGQVLAAHLGTTYEDLRRTRVFDPIGLTASHTGERAASAPPGRSAAGHHRAPWWMDGYAPAGGVVSTVDDMAVLARSLLDGSAPGVAALDPIEGVASERSDRRSGLFWVVDPGLTWHNGQTGGYSSFLGLQRERGRAVVVLADLARVTDHERLALALLG